MSEDFTLPPSLAGIAAEDAVDILWRKGILTWKLNSCQKNIYDFFQKGKTKIQVWNCSRRLGKSYLLLIVALEYCIRKKNVQVKYCASTSKMVSKIIKPTLKVILEDCPKDIRPTYDRELGAYKFTNGSLLFIEGLDKGNAENLRGTPMHLGIVDEAGFVDDDLDYIVGSILSPMTLTTKGRIILSSTPPPNSDHAYVRYLRRAEANDSYIKKSIYDYLKDVENDPPRFKERITPEIVEAERLSTLADAWDREYLCKIVTSTENAVLPEFTDELQQEIVREWRRPQMFDVYHAMDLGIKDLTAVVLAYYDFKEGKLVIEDEVSFNGRNVTSTSIGAGIKAKHDALFFNTISGQVKDVYRQICDNNEPIAINELNIRFNFKFVPTRKDDKDAAINDLRIKLQERKIIINPRCKQLIYHLKNALWDKNRKQYVRSSNAGHFDFVDAMIYLVRNIEWNRNPYPANYNRGPSTFDSQKRIQEYTGTAAGVAKMLGIGKKLTKLNK
jgi:hypothetical protein